MSEFNIEVEGGSSVRLPTSGKYCPKDIIVTAKGGSSAGGGDINALIDGTLTELKSDATSIRVRAFYELIPLTEASFPNATAVGTYAFYWCSNLTRISIPNVTSIGTYAFHDCSKLTFVDFPYLTKAEDYVFRNCNNLSGMNLPSLTRIGNSSFATCRSLLELNFPHVITTGNYAFQYCENVKKATFNSLTGVSNYMFQYCYDLEIADFSKLNSISSGAFVGCKSLKALILRGETVCRLSYTGTFNNCYHILGTVDATYNPNGDKDGYFYVPRALVDTYRAATNWVDFDTQFRALEDYTVDGTINGELDKNKI